MSKAFDVIRFGTKLCRLFVCGVMIGAVSPVMAAPDQAADKDAERVAGLHGELARSFRLAAQLPLDAELRYEADSIASAHLARIRQLLPAWFAEERRLQAGEGVKTSDNTVYMAVWARVLNELALWQLEPGDAAYEKATLEAVKNSRLTCEIADDPRFHDFAGRILRIQAMPPAQRKTALDNERRLLEHWATPRPALKPWPDPLPQDAAMAAIGKIRDGGDRPAPALIPALAYALLGERGTYAEQPWQSKCNLQRWWLGVSLAQGASPEAALNAFRYATLIGAAERFGQAPDSETEAAPKGAATPSYPEFARHFDVSGSTRVSRRFDDAGKPVAASVIKRKIAVRGIRGVRPVAFETTFDDLAVHYALQGGDGGRPGAPLAPTFDMVWALDDQKGGKQ